MIASTSNNLDVQCANCSGSGVSTADGASWTAGSSLFAGIGGAYQTTVTSNPLTAGDQGFAQLTHYRALMTDWFNSSGTEMGTSGSPVQVSLANTGANGTAVAISAASLPLPTNAAAETGGNLATLAGAVTASVVQSNTKQVNGVTTLAGAGATGTGSQRVTAAQDTTTIAGSAPGTAGSASTNVVTVQGIGVDDAAAGQSRNRRQLGDPGRQCGVDGRHDAADGHRLRVHIRRRDRAHDGTRGNAGLHQRSCDFY